MMVEYIEREAVLLLAKDICVLTKWDTEYHHRSIDPADVRELPAADVRPVVTCADCKFWYRERISCEGLARCNTGESGIRYRNRNDFCSRGEKREEQT